MKNKFPILILALSLGLGSCSSDNSVHIPQYVFSDEFSAWESGKPSGWELNTIPSNNTVELSSTSEGKGIIVDLSKPNSPDVISFSKSIPLSAGLHRVTVQLEADTLVNIEFIFSRLRHFQLNPGSEYFPYVDEYGVKMSVQPFVMQGRYVNIRRFYKDGRRKCVFMFRVDGDPNSTFELLFKKSTIGSQSYVVDFVKIEQI